MLDTSELELVFSAAYHQWVTEQEGHVKCHDETVCDFCELPPLDGCLYSVPGEDDHKYQVCEACFLPLFGEVTNGPGGDRDTFYGRHNMRLM